MPQQTVHAYTDGSFDASSATSSWAVTIGDEWLDENHLSVPTDESLVQPHHVRGAAMAGASIDCTRGIYPAELQAIARTLAMFPASFILHIHSDSQASIAAIRSYELLTNERRRMRMAAHTLLQLIHHLLRARRAAGGDVFFHHVRAHTDSSDIHSVGNRLSDYQANRCRPANSDSTPVNLQPLPLQQCQPHLFIIDDSETHQQVIDDVRQTAMRQLKRTEMQRWQAKKNGSEYFASKAALDTGRVVLRHGSAEQQSTFVHLATNSIHRLWAPSLRVPGKESVQQLLCVHCSEITPRTVLTPEHLGICPAPLGIDYRMQLHRDILQLLRLHPETAEWLRVNASVPHPSLSSSLLSLFPHSVGAASTERHLTYAMCGVLTSSQLTVAARIIGFDLTIPFDRAKGISVIQQLSLICISHPSRFFAREKVLALAE